jgi:heme/copper-type cytochrome/quinol oxidase subunit 2
VIVMRPADFQQWARAQKQKGAQASAG